MRSRAQQPGVVCLSPVSLLTGCTAVGQRASSSDRVRSALCSLHPWGVAGWASEGGADRRADGASAPGPAPPRTGGTRGSRLQGSGETPARHVVQVWSGQEALTFLRPLRHVRLGPAPTSPGSRAIRATSAPAAARRLCGHVATWARLRMLIPFTR